MFCYVSFLESLKHGGTLFTEMSGGFKKSRSTPSECSCVGTTRWIKVQFNFMENSEKFSFPSKYTEKKTTF